MTRLLLSSVCRPLGPAYGDGLSVGAEVFNGQIAFAQGIFCPRCVQPHYPLDLIAANIDTPATVIQYPTEEQFVAELANDYDFVGISFNLSTFHKAVRMSRLVRTHAPRARIIFGGYGTVLGDDVLAPHADHICRGEGVAFMRSLLGKPPADLPYRHPLIVIHPKLCSLPIGDTGVLMAGLGCANGCDFCCTSHFFKRKHVRLLPRPEDLLDLVNRYHEQDPGMPFALLDEDFLNDEAWARRFLECVRSSGKTPPSLFTHSSLRAVSRFTAAEIAEMGVSTLWIGYEGRRSGYPKQSGTDWAVLLEDLQNHGISVLLSYIMGFEYQTREIIEAEIDELLSLEASFHQFMIYQPNIGTPLYDRAAKDELIRSEYRNDPDRYYRHATGFYSIFKHPTLSAAELEELQQKAYQTEYRRLGPSVIRVLEVRLKGYPTLLQSPSPTLRRVAETWRREILTGMPMLLTASLLGPTAKSRRAAAALVPAIRKTLGVPFGILHVLQSGIFLLAAFWTALCLRFDWFQQPTFQRKKYGPGSRES